ncbi:macro domain-containing protein [Echinicola sp. 20G]|uniref:macro domain-containing protein n=1 Tax=Echinicola sp. 20G TaxID=2781961 RepID=UPI001910AED2|nr:macro domain-containing protein [Echinicola sp. 20G]
MARLINHIELINRKGDITKQSDVDVIVNAANAQLRTGGGVAGAIHKAAGPDIERAAVPLGPIQPGEAVITEGFRLPNKYVIHCLGPVYGKDKPEAKFLGNCYREALKLADDYQMTSIAFPAISTGVFGYPVEEAAKVAFSSIMAIMPELKSIRKIYLVLFGDNDFRIHEEELKKINP